MSSQLSNTAVPKYYGAFRQAVLDGKIPVCNTISLEMNRIDNLIKSPMYYYDPTPVEGWIDYCESELTLTDGGDVKLLDTFKLWGEQIFGWYVYQEKSVSVRDEKGNIRFVKKPVKYRLCNKQFLIIPRSNAKTIYASFIQDYFLNVDGTTTYQMAVAPTMAQAEEVMSPIRTAITRSKGPYHKLLTYGSNQNTTGSKINRPKLRSTKLGIQNDVTGSILVVKPCRIDALQGQRVKCATLDEWLSVEMREDPIGAIEQSAAKIKDYLILATSSEGTVRNGVGDSIKMELMDILMGKYYAPHVSIWYYRLDDISEISKPALWFKASPNLEKTVTLEAYKRDIDRAEHSPANRNDILAKRFNIPSEGLTYFFTFEETKCHRRREYWQMPCSIGVDLSKGDDFCSFAFLFPLEREEYGIKTRSYITSKTYQMLQPAIKQKYRDFIEEGTLIIMEGTTLDLNDVYDDLDKHIINCDYDVRSLGFDPAYSKEFMTRWAQENGPFGIEKVLQNYTTESVPLGELKKLAAGRQLLFDEEIMHFCMGNCVVDEDTNGNRRLYKRRHDEKVDCVAALMDAYIAYNVNKELFD